MAKILFIYLFLKEGQMKHCVTPNKKNLLLKKK